ncbi:DUF998 domain-containing protein [Pseudonocardia thermophila]|jgi:hypothetical protein|uniref:DUF998 domain-containing protein n=1 Tax=Pseudonocardia thermophila TaxID=1848 RepID=UPI00248F03A8|nr:DUF998 domain-containing protein [Pseudonocardia thermophila]
MTVTAARTRTHDVRTRRLLAGLVAAPVVFGVVSLAQAFTREGFDLVRFPISMLSNGDLGWLQITNFVVSGLLTLAGALGLRQALRGSPGGVWAPRLVAVTGIGLVLAGPFVLQGGGGFPVGDPGVPGMTASTIGHLVVGTIAFAALIAANFVAGHHYSRTGQARLARGSRLAGAVFLAGDLYSTAGGYAGPLVLAVTVLVAMGWLGVVAAVERRR